VARELGLPVAIHDREAHLDTFRILTEERAWELGGVFHDFTRDPAVAEIVVGMGLHVSLDGMVTWRDRKAYRQLARTIPLEQLVLETDTPAPYTPEPNRGGKNEPAYVARVAAEIAALRDIPVDALARVTTANARRLYRIPAAAIT
jgi:TatD DNase family protein